MFDELVIGDIKFHLKSVDDNQLTYTNAKTYQDYLDMNYVKGKNQLEYNVLSLTLFYERHHFKPYLNKAILLKGNKNTGFKLVFDNAVDCKGDLDNLFVKYCVKEKL